MESVLVVDIAGLTPVLIKQRRFPLEVLLLALVLADEQLHKIGFAVVEVILEILNVLVHVHLLVQQEVILALPRIVLEVVVVDGVVEGRELQFGRDGEQVHAQDRHKVAPHQRPGSLATVHMRNIDGRDDDGGEKGVLSHVAELLQLGGELAQVQVAEHSVEVLVVLVLAQLALLRLQVTHLLLQLGLRDLLVDGLPLEALEVDLYGLVAAFGELQGGVAHANCDAIINMSIIYAAIGRSERIFTEYTASTGNFIVIANQVMKACDSRKYMKYPASGYVFYVLNVECTFMVMCQQAYSERIAFSFLETVRKLFTGSFSEERIGRAKMYQMMEFTPVLKTQVNLYNEPEQVDKVARLLKETEEVSKIIEEDLQKILMRGQKLDILVKKTETMATLSLEMKNSSRTIRNDMMWKNWKMRILLALVVLAVVYVLLVLGCSGFALQGCF